MTHTFRKILFLILVVAIALPGSSFALASTDSPAAPISFTVLHTNDFHGQLEWKSGGSSSNPGSARVAKVVNDVRAAVGDSNVLLLDMGDQMQGSLLSNLWQGEPVIAVYNEMRYAASTFGNHEFDWGQQVLIDRTTQADYPYLSANIVVNDTGNCATAGWTAPSFATPYVIQTVGTAPNQVRVGLVGVTTTEVPTITIAEATEGLCFQDPLNSILHYYDEIKAQSDVVIVMSHLGYNDGGYGYGLPVIGDKTLAQKLIDAGKPVNMIIGGHSHTDLGPLVQSDPAQPLPTQPAVYTKVGNTSIVQAYYNGRRVGRADLTFDPSNGAVTVNWQSLVVNSASAADPAVDAIVLSYANDPDYQAKINEPIGYAQTELLRNYNGNSMMADFIDDAIYNQLNSDAEPANDVDMFFNNPGGIRTDWCDKEDPAGSGNWVWSATASDCGAPGIWSHDAMLLNYGQMFTILPFGNATVVGDMTGAQILEVLNQAASLNKGALQPAGLRYTFYHYKGGTPARAYAWGSWDVCVTNKATGVCEPLDLQRTYKVGTNEFLAPAGGDNFSAFKYMTDVSYWGDMLNRVNDYVKANYTMATPYRGPNDDGLLDGRITRDGNDTTGSIVPITVLHHNDSHGRLNKTSSAVGYTQLATLINQERAYNPTRTILLSTGDNIQGDSMMYFFRTAPQGFASDGTVLPADMQINPLIKAFNAMNYDAYTLGNHEFNFGSTVFQTTLSQANMPVMQANLSDDGQYGLDAVPVVPYVEKSVGAEGIKVAILGIGNHRVPNYELPSNIPGLTFTDPLVKAQELSDDLRGSNDVLLALTHIGFTENPSSVEVDKNVDTTMAAETTGLDLIVGGHSHTDPSKQTAASGTYKYLPAIVAGPGNTPVIVTQAYRYNTYLGEVFLGMRPKAGGGYEVVSRAGQYLAVTSSTAEDATIKAIVDPYVTMLNAYNNTEAGKTTVPIDALKAFTEETNGTNLQADSAVYELETHGIDVDFHLSGAMTNAKIADSATPEAPYTLLVSDMFKLMPYENSLVVLKMNGPQIKAVLERAYRNFYYYKYVPGYGGYSYYTTCMLGTMSGGEITYNDLYPAAYDPNREYVVSYKFNGHEVDFADADTYYNVSTVNYLAAGSCNFNNAGVTLWPLDQIVADTQYYVRDAVINYSTAMGTISPAIEGRLQFVFDDQPPVITIYSPLATTYLQTDLVSVLFSAEDVGVTGLRWVTADVDGVPVENGEVLDLVYWPAGKHVLTVTAMDRGGNSSTATVTFYTEATIHTLMAAVTRFFNEGEIDNPGLFNALMSKLAGATRAMVNGDVDGCPLHGRVHPQAGSDQRQRHHRGSC